MWNNYSVFGIGCDPYEGDFRERSLLKQTQASALPLVVSLP